MRATPILLSILALTGSQTLQSGDFGPIPQAVWDMKEDPAKGWKGAVVLEDRMTFMNTYVEYRYRVRIFSEAGRRAAEFGTFSAASYDIEGRTVYPDGRVVPFSQRKDFASKTTSVGDSDSKRTVLVPPGVTGDCVVELRWRESSANKWSPLPARFGLSHSFEIANAFPTLEYAVAVPNGSFRFAYIPYGSRTIRPEVVEKGGFRTFTYRNVPAKEEVPYSLDVTRDFPRFVIYDIPDILRSAARDTPQAFWKQASQVYFKDVFEGGVKKGKAYQGLMAELWQGVSGGPQAEALKLMVKLDARIRNLSRSTFAEIGATTKQQAEEEIDSLDLEAAARRGTTDAFGMSILYFNLLKDRGIKPKVVLVTDRDRRMFAYNLPDARQFQDEIIKVEEPGKEPLWGMPGLRFAQPGMIHPDYQGTPALEFETQNWTAAPVTVGAQGSGFNVRRYQVEVRPEDGADKFSIKATFSGFPEYAERYTYMALEPKEQVRVLRERLERYLKGATFSRVEVKGAQDAKALVSWEAEGSLEVEEGRQRLVSPFPSVPYSLFIPDDLPAERRDPIVVPYLRVQETTSVIHVPEGWKWSGGEPSERSNRFGIVRWTADAQPDGSVKVAMRVEVTGFFEAAAAYGEFKEFLGWIKEAAQWQIALQKAR